MANIDYELQKYCNFNEAENNSTTEFSVQSKIIGAAF